MSWQPDVPFLIITAFIFGWIVIIVLAVRAYIRRHLSWRRLPTLREYLSAHPTRSTDTGVKCRVCNASSIRNWGLLSAHDARRMFICNQCGTALYRSD